MDCLLTWQVEPLLEMDRDEKKFETFLSYHKKTMTVGDLRVFVPFSINLDPYVKKVIKEEVQNIQEISGLSFEHFLASQAGEAVRPALPKVMVAPPSNVNLAGMAASTAGQQQQPGGQPMLTRRQAIGLQRRMSQTDLSRQGSMHGGGGAGAAAGGMLGQTPFGLYGIPPQMQQFGAGMWNPYINMAPIPDATMQHAATAQSVASPPTDRSRVSPSALLLFLVGEAADGGHGGAAVAQDHRGRVRRPSLVVRRPQRRPR